MNTNKESQLKEVQNAPDYLSDPHLNIKTKEYFKVFHGKNSGNNVF